MERISRQPEMRTQVRRFSGKIGKGGIVDHAILNCL